MGSCLSKKDKDKEKGKRSGDDPPPPPEEKVKEVLLETPKLPTLRSRGELNKEEEEEEEKKKLLLPDLGFDHASQGTSSASTLLFEEKKTTKKRVEEEEEDQVGLEQKRTLKRDRAVGGAGCRSVRSSPSPPVRRTHSARETPARNRTAPPPCDKFRRDHGGDRSTRRSVSPAAKHHRSAATAGAHVGGQCRSLSAPRSVKGRCSAQRIPGKVAAAKDEEEEEESLENPLVSLECFIFL